MFVPDDAAFDAAPAGTFDTKPDNRAQLTGVLTNLILPGTVLAADIDKAIDGGKGKAMLATMGGGTLTATKDGGKIVLTDSAGHKATITQARRAIQQWRRPSGRCGADAGKPAAAPPSARSRQIAAISWLGGASAARSLCSSIHFRARNGSL